MFADTMNLPSSVTIKSVTLLRIWTRLSIDQPCWQNRCACKAKVCPASRGLQSKHKLSWCHSHLSHFLGWVMRPLCHRLTQACRQSSSKLWDGNTPIAPQLYVYSEHHTIPIGRQLTRKRGDRNASNFCRTFGAPQVFVYRLKHNWA